ncbi:hypothetical protein KPZU09_54300 [Klebsiella pneumoniae]|uniref:Uncharacterized protein n=1 Tax=Klebsiella pneumoniae TaxID=573 RepID=A0A919LV98_KLEPN|nr:hypothetical protein KPZU09_54300 [Klebsiella pneumoniae]
MTICSSAWIVVVPAGMGTQVGHRRRNGNPPLPIATKQPPANPATAPPATIATMRRGQDDSVTPCKNDTEPTICP